MRGHFLPHHSVHSAGVGKMHVVTAFASQTSDRLGDDISTRLESSTNVVLQAGMTPVQLTHVLWTAVHTAAGRQSQFPTTGKWNVKMSSANAMLIECESNANRMQCVFTKCSTIGTPSHSEVRSSHVTTMKCSLQIHFFLFFS